MRKVRADGTVWYYSYKKKRGRHKKPGPKKKKVYIPHPRVYPTWDFKIIHFSNNKQAKYIGRYHDLKGVYAAKEKLEEENSKVIFPRMCVNNGRNDAEIYAAKEEYVILKRNTEGKESTLLRNEFGKLVDHTVDNENWIIYDKFPCIQEETFWAYGYDQKTDRKTFEWIYQTFILDVIENPENIVNVYLYNNKVIFRYDNKEFNFVICKNMSDAIRMYNLIEKWKKRNKQIILTGNACDNYERKCEIIDMIRDKTGWKNKKIWERSTRH